MRYDSSSASSDLIVSKDEAYSLGKLLITKPCLASDSLVQTSHDGPSILSKHGGRKVEK